MLEPIKGIEPLWTTPPLSSEQEEPAQGVSGMFSDIFQAAIDRVKSTDADKNKAEYLLATGQLDNPAELTIASTKAQLSVDLLVQLRNKALDAYSEVMRLSL